MTENEKTASSENLPRVILAIRHFWPDGGGAEVSARNLGAGLVRRGLPLTILTGRYGLRKQIENMDGVTIRRHFIGAYVPVLHELCYLASLAWELIALRRKYDIVHVFQIQLAAFVAVVLGKRLGKRVVVSSRCAGAAGDMAVWSSIPGGSRLLKTVCAGVDAATAVSTEVRDELLRAGFNSERTYYIPNGVPLSPPTNKTKSMFRRRLGLPQDRFIALFVGRLAEQKAPEFLIEAWKGVIDNHPASRLIFLGDGEKRSELEAEVRTAGMEDFIHFAGRVDDVESYLHAADLFVLPSVTEGMSMALLEAMANRLPVVASRVSGTSDILRHEENGLLFESGDRDGLTAAISSLIESPKRREELGQRARETVEKDYALDKAVDRYYRLYDSLL